MEADHKSAAHVAAVWRETYPAGSTQSNMGAAYQEALQVLGALLDARTDTSTGWADRGLEAAAIARAILTAAGR